MANLTNLLSPELITTEDLDDDLAYLIIPDSELQLQVDCLNVLQGNISIDTFPAEYQELIKNYYRFSGTRMNTKNSKIAKRTNDTLDIV